MSELQKSISKISSENKMLIKENQNLKNSLTDLKCSKMQDNLIFHGIPESNENENCQNIIHDICRRHLKICDAEEIVIDRAHRIGNSSRDEGPRPIVVKFNQFQQREEIRNKKQVLATTDESKHIRITEQYPKVVRERRKQLYPIFNEARQNNQRAVLVRDRLYINWVLYNSESELDLCTNGAEVSDSDVMQFNLNGERRKRCGRGGRGRRGRGGRGGNEFNRQDRFRQRSPINRNSTSSNHSKPSSSQMDESFTSK